MHWQDHHKVKDLIERREGLLHNIDKVGLELFDLTIQGTYQRSRMQPHHLNALRKVALDYLGEELHSVDTELRKLGLEFED